MELELEVQNLNNQQRSFYHNVLEGGYVVCIAVPGAGKTKTLTVAVAGLVFEKQVPPEQIFVSTFTKKAAEEMKERIAKTVSEDVADRLHIYTFHSFCYQMAKRYGAQFVKDLDKVKLLAEEQEYFFKTVLNNLLKKLHGSEVFTEEEITAIKEYEGTFLDRINDLKNRNILCNNFFKNKDLKDFSNKTFFYVWSEYEKVKAEKLYIDFNDIMILFNKLLNNPIFRSLVKPYTQFIIVDEFQDTNDLQMEILEKLSNGNVAVVGDDAQSIYAFRNANVKLILEFEEKYNAKKILMDTNYRSHEIITKAATELIFHNKGNLKKEIIPYFPVPEDSITQIKKFVTSFEEANFIADFIQKNKNKLGTIGIIYRNNIIGAEIAKQLKKRGIFYDYKEEYNLFERKEIKLFFRFLNYYLTENEETLIGLFKEQKGIGEKIIDATIELEGETFLEKALNSSKKPVKLFAELVKEMKENPLLSNPIEFFNHLMYTFRFCDMEESRVENLMYLKQIIFDKQELESITLKKLMRLKDESCKLITCHSSKGLEFDTCFLPAFSQDIIPSKTASLEKDGIEEERRLAYVAITRAKKNLIITHADNRFDTENVRELRPSMFLSEFNTEKFNFEASSKDNVYKGSGGVPLIINDQIDELLNI